VCNTPAANAELLFRPTGNAREPKFRGIERHRALLPSDFGAEKIRRQRRLRQAIVQLMSLPFNDLTTVEAWRFVWSAGTGAAVVGDCFSAADCGRAADAV